MSFSQRMILSMMAVLLLFTLVNSLLVFTILYKADGESIDLYNELLYESEEQAINSWLEMLQPITYFYVDLSIKYPDSTEIYKDMVTNYLRKARWTNLEHDDSYFFAFEASSGTSIISSPFGIVKKENYILDLKDLNGFEFVKEIRDNAVMGNRTPVHYLYSRRCFDCPPVEKIAIGLYIREWDWVIATGSYIDKFKKKSSTFAEKFSKSRLTLMENLFGVMLVSLLLGIAMILHQMKAFMVSFKSLSGYVHGLATQGIRHLEIDIPKNSQLEVESLAKDMNEVIGNVGVLMDKVRNSADKVSDSTGNINDMIGVVRFDAEVVGNRSSEMLKSSEEAKGNVQDVSLRLDSINKNLESLKNFNSRVTTNTSDITDSMMQISGSIDELNKSSQSLLEHTVSVAQTVSDLGKAAYEEINKISDIEAEFNDTIQGINLMTERTAQLRLFVSKCVSYIRKNASNDPSLSNTINVLSEEIDSLHSDMINIQLQISSIHEIKIIPLTIVLNERKGVTKEVKQDAESLIDSVTIIADRISKINTTSQYISVNATHLTKDISEAFHSLEAIVGETDTINEHSKQTSGIMVELSKKSSRLMEAHKAIESTLLEVGKEMKQLNELSVNLRKIVDGLVRLESHKKKFVREPIN